MQISDEVVEAAAKALAMGYGDPRGWRMYLGDTRAALEAAVPHMLAEVRERVDRLIEDKAIDNVIVVNCETLRETVNPYRSQA